MGRVLKQLVLVVVLMGCGGSGSGDSAPFDYSQGYSAAERAAFEHAEACLGLKATAAPRVVYRAFELTPRGCVVRDEDCPFPPVGSSQYCLSDNTIAIGMPEPGTTCNDFIQHYYAGWPAQALRTEFLNAVAYENGIYQDQYGSPCDRS